MRGSPQPQQPFERTARVILLLDQTPPSVGLLSRATYRSIPLRDDAIGSGGSHQINDCLSPGG